MFILRRTRPDLPRPFRVPMCMIICPLGAVACLYLFWQPFEEHWTLMGGLTLIGLAV